MTMTLIWHDNGGWALLLARPVCVVAHWVAWLQNSMALLWRSLFLRVGRRWGLVEMLVSALLVLFGTIPILRGDVMTLHNLHIH